MVCYPMLFRYFCINSYVCWSDYDCSKRIPNVERHDSFCGNNIMSIFFLGKRYYRHHWTALMLVVVGVAIVGASPIIFPDDGSSKDSSSNPIFGLILVLAGQVFSGLTMV
mmetsp:Transcript_17344/g.19417  ORF Transcript_17344/g.19417 Transcript_17344/m.19417 type:complete len:110 (+) Transcript_17344:317-646(+)